MKLKRGIRPAQAIVTKTSWIAPVAVGLGLLLPQSKAMAWGEVGHETIAAIALKHLDPAVKAKIQDLLGDGDFVESALWADKIKYVAAWCHTAPYHFADIPEDEDYFSTLQNDDGSCSGKPDVIQALLQAETQLASTANTRADRRNALKFLIHFVGDLHQPLHVGHPDDLGGNKIPLTWADKKTNLHSVWDTYMIKSAHADDFGSMTVAEQADWYAANLDSDTAIASEVVDPAAWLNESLHNRVSAYTGYDDESVYQEQNLPIIERQLKAAGYRLAAWLNAVLANEKGYLASQAERALRQHIVAICPDFEDTIDLTESSAYTLFELRLDAFVPWARVSPRSRACSEAFQDLD